MPVTCVMRLWKALSTDSLSSESSTIDSLFISTRSSSRSETRDAVAPSLRVRAAVAP
ncbi:hypothetical protein ACFPM0_36625 [Pseudonocardia sulfidoxydans]|uniref:hypothetical protein n=1 Tax=Pseudonocardia sulfidoxydans TaxID=54011 RepID=UPI00360BAB56